MPALRSLRRERFCQMVIEGSKYGWTQDVCYLKAGYRGSGHGCAVNASKLLKATDIQERIRELTAPAVKKARVTADTLAEQFDAVFNGAMGSAQFGPAGAAAAAKAKLLGFMRERLELGSVGEFDGTTSAEGVALQMLRDHDGSLAAVLEGLDMLRDLVIKAAGDQAKVVVSSPPPYRRVDETGLALRTLRPSRR